ncbi:hypothetical protein MYSTI_01316 [Myxococcus stipitatus DSM 14675]|uniref:Uncharacterized protein n=1 Tax=Myxococcus stipitatus (strain DSM 14675 / JCM 12634 / Mx s8) TaxID=1278073 RepID=L7U850_MYXSD|nr:hypothetical protein [Myxococcus stipitatus]AGC42664.1 hypothetical protein MYSTI_01316 [Myxococcus stipitatus DSM 14675]
MRNRLNFFSRARASRAPRGILALLLALLCARPAWADTYDIVWETVSYIGSKGSNNNATIVREGIPIFDVNLIPLPTYTVPNQLRAAQNGDRYNMFHAPFDSVLLRPGANSFYFGITTVGGDGQTYTTELVRLARPGQSPLPLFSVNRAGTAFTGATNVNFSLRELNPGLADRIAEMERAISEDRNKILGNATSIADMQARQARLDSLQAELEALLQKGFDELTAAELDALLKRYADLPAGTRNALVNLVADLKKNVAQLRAEIARITTELGLHVDEAVSLIEAAVAQAGHDLNSPDSFETGSGLDEVPDVTVPEVVPNDDFDPEHDPYAAFAQQVISRLEQQMGTGSAEDRRGFLSTVRSWRVNVAAMQRSLEARAAVSTQEWAAFLNARQSVASYVLNFMDESGWFLDSPIPLEIRERLDSVLMAHTPQAANALKDALAGWDANMTPEERLFLDTINAMLQGAASAIMSVDWGFERLLELTQMVNSAATAAVEISRVLVGFTPVGDILDLCEAVTGKKFCMPGGENLSTEERVASGLGVFIGSGAFWHGVMAVAPVGARVAKTIDNLLLDLGAAEARLLRTRLGDNAIAHLGDLTGAQIKHLADVYGDVFVTKFASTVGGESMHKVVGLDIFGAVWSPAVRDTVFTKNLGAAVRNLPPMKGMYLDEVRLLLPQKGFVMKASDNVQEVWAHADGSIIRIAPNGTGGRPRPHLKKEISHTPNQWADADIACKVTDTNVLVPQGQKEARAGFNKWFREAMMAKSKNAGARDLDAAERAMLEQIWADASHMDLTPL